MDLKPHKSDTDRLIRFIVEHTQTQFGRAYFRVLVRHLAEGLKVKGAWVTELLEKEHRLRSFAFWVNGKFVDHYEYDLANTPCERVVADKDCLLVSERLIELYPKDPDLPPLNAMSYMGYPLFGEEGNVIGHLAILHDAPLYPSKEQEAVFSLFVQRANAELLRLKAFDELQERKLRLTTLIDSMHESILEVDALGFITLANPAASKLFGFPENELTGILIFSLFEEESAAIMRNILKEARTKPDRDDKYPQREELYVFNSNGSTIPVEGSFCRYAVNAEIFHTVILRDLKDLRRAEQRIKILEEDLIQKENSSVVPIIGECRELQKVMEDLGFVAKSNSSVLLLGESGTGKEVFARYIHDLSSRRPNPLIIVNCAAIPFNLIESEFFGHEKGAFTGALQRREGRFALADGGTLFLDEIGELPLDIQPKLLRVLQEGEFETLGGNRTIKTDVRIIAATNRNLEEMVNTGTFREDLYYRLNVIPISLPPLRERGRDIILLADLFIKKYSKQAGKKIRPLDNESVDTLLSYNWPGNIRELQHVIERAVILSKNEHLQLERFIPTSAMLTNKASGLVHSQSDNNRILTMEDLDNLEKQNLLQALEKTAWKISGNSGAAALLGIPPSTLNSKIKAFGILKPQ